VTLFADDDRTRAGARCAVHKHRNLLVHAPKRFELAIFRLFFLRKITVLSA
jgi:hypothetical protein